MREGRNRTIDYCRKNSESCEQTGIGAIPHEWALRPLTEFAQQERNAFSNGPFGSDLLSNELQTQGVPVIYIRDISRYVFNWRSRVYVSDQKATQLSAFSVRFGDVLITKVGSPPCEAAVYNKDIPSVITQDVIRLRPSKGVDSYFLMLMINSLYAQREVRKIKIEGTRERVSLTDFKKIKLPFPPLPEQRKIAAILSTWDEAIEKTQSLIHQIRQRNKGLAQQLLTGKKRLPGFAKASASKKRVTTEWKVYSVAEIFDFLKNASFSRDNLGDGNFYYLHYGDIHVKFRQPILKVTGNETIPRLKYEFETSNNFDLLQNGDVVIADASEDTEGIGDCIEIQNVGGAKVIAGLHTIALRDSMGLTAQLFRGYYFKSDTIRNQLRKLATGISVYGISKTSVKKIRMILPPKPEQEAIAQVLEQANEELHLYEQKLVTLQFQKKGLMQKLLTGELRVKTNVI